MQKKEVKKWQDEEALKRYCMIVPLLDEGLDVSPDMEKGQPNAESMLDGLAVVQMDAQQSACRKVP